MDKDRILKVLEELDSYMNEIKGIIPDKLADYKGSVKKRACERLLQISIESVINVSDLIVREMKLGMPSNEDDIFQKLRKEKIVSAKMLDTLKRMKGFRNILVHRYGEVDDELVFDFLKRNLADFSNFKKEVLDFLARK